MLRSSIDIFLLINHNKIKFVKNKELFLNVAKLIFD